MRYAKSRRSYLLLYLTVFLVVFAVAYTVQGQGPGNVGDEEDPSITNPVPGGPDDGEVGPVAQVNELFDIILAPAEDALDLLDTFLDDGGSPNLADKEGTSAAQWSILSSEYNSVVNGQVKRLLEAGANPNHVDDDGRTAIHYAAEFGGSEAVVTTLISAGANPDLADNSGITPLEIALRTGNDGVVAALERATSVRPAGYTQMKALGKAAKWLEEKLGMAKAKDERDAAIKEWSEKLRDDGVLTDKQAKQVYENVSTQIDSQSEDGNCGNCEDDKGGE